MQNIWNDFISILSNIAFIDYVLFGAVIVLIILVVSLFYVMKIEGEQKEEVEMEPVKDEELDLNNIVETIDENPKPLFDMTAYENEQEQKAIISYDELLEKTGQLKLDYEEEKVIDDEIPVKKIQLAPVEDSEVELKPREVAISHNFFSTYEKEEAFLNVLKQMNELLNG